MKKLLSFVFSVSMCCLQPSNGVAADEAKPELFTLVSAQYGAGDRWVDVSEKVQAAAENDALTIEASNANFGDPLRGRRSFSRS